jgi:hypothetical protein
VTADRTLTGREGGVVGTLELEVDGSEPVVAVVTEPLLGSRSVAERGFRTGATPTTAG